MNNRSPLTILVVDRPLKSDEQAGKDIFNVYGEKYGLIIFPPKEDDKECRIQIVFFEYKLMSALEAIFHNRIEYEMDEPPDFFDFDLTEIDLDSFYDMLNQDFEVKRTNLTEIENNKSH